MKTLETKPVPTGRLLPSTIYARSFGQEDFEEMVRSVSLGGVQTPPRVRHYKGRPAGWYELIYGHCRTAACRHLGHETVTVEIVEATDKEAAIMILTEHIRHSPKAIDEIEYYRRTADIFDREDPDRPPGEHYLSDSRIADLIYRYVGKSRDRVRRIMGSAATKPENIERLARCGATHQHMAMAKRRVMRMTEIDTADKETFWVDVVVEAMTAKPKPWSVDHMDAVLCARSLNVIAPQRRVLPVPDPPLPPEPRHRCPACFREWYGADFPPAADRRERIRWLSKALDDARSVVRRERREDLRRRVAAMKAAK